MKRRNLIVGLLLVCLIVVGHSLWRASAFSRKLGVQSKLKHKLPPYLEGKTRQEILQIVRQQKKRNQEPLDKVKVTTRKENSVKRKGAMSLGCSPVKHYFLLKTHKCASTTVQNILLRYAWNDNLTVMLPAAGNFFTAIGWPRDPKPHHLMPHPDNKQFDVLANHIIYDRTFVKTFLKHDTVSVGLLREPFDHFMSLWGFFAVKVIIQKDEYVFLDDPFEYDAVPCSYPPQGPLPLKNFQAVQFGLKKGDMVNEAAIQKFLKRLGEEFSLVIIKEYLDESLILLMRTLCWDFRDILHYKLNAFKPRTYGLNFTEQHINNYKNWSAVDYKLYDHFNKTLWRKVKEAKGFAEDLAKFKELNKKMNEFCERENRNHDYVPREEEIGITRWGAPLTVDSNLCTDLSLQDMAFTHMFANRQYPDKDPGHFSVECCRT